MKTITEQADYDKNHEERTTPTNKRTDESLWS